MRLKDLKHNEKNPRKMSADKKALLKKSLEVYGDLGGVVFNRTSGRLVGAHQRTSVLPSEAKITITQKYDTPTRAGTVAQGFIELEDERFSYREVIWDQKKEAEAMVAANKHQGDWDHDVLRLLVADVPGMDLELAGFDMGEIKSLNLEIAPMPQIEETEQSDEAYVKENPGPDSELRKENITTAATQDFESVKEETKVEGKRYVIIIDCPDQEIKESLREKIMPEVLQAQCKIF